MSLYVLCMIYNFFIFWKISVYVKKKKLIARFRIEPKRKHHSSWKRKKLMIRRRQTSVAAAAAIPCFFTGRRENVTIARKYNLFPRSER